MGYTNKRKRITLVGTFNIVYFLIYYINLINLIDLFNFPLMTCVQTMMK